MAPQAIGHCNCSFGYTQKYYELIDGFSDWAETISDNKTWIDFLYKKENIIWSIVRRKIQVRG